VAAVTRVGRCVGCNRFRAVDADDSICNECLTSKPLRGRRWALMVLRCRTDPRFAREVFDAIRSDHGRLLFIKLLGVPRPCAEGEPSDE
jgi:hypothetical protein